MENNLFKSPELQITSDIYREFVNSVGVNSLPAQRYYLEQEALVQAGIVGKRIEVDDLWTLQDALYDRSARGEITNEVLFESLELLSRQRNHTRDYDEATRRLQEYESIAMIEIPTNAVVTAQINELLQNTRSFDDDQNRKNAPFKEYATNSDTVWQYKDSHTVKSFLKAKPFIQSTVMTGAYEHAQSITHISNYENNPDVRFEIPTRLMVNAAGFSSWLGRSDRAGNEGFGEKAIALRQFQFDYKSISLDAIRAYASHRNDLPYVGQVEVFLQPNGLAYAGNCSGDSHRISAAILRGDKNIKSMHLSVVLLRDNYIPST